MRDIISKPAIVFRVRVAEYKHPRPKITPTRHNNFAKEKQTKARGRVDAVSDLRLFDAVSYEERLAVIALDLVTDE